MLVGSKQLVKAVSLVELLVVMLLLAIVATAGYMAVFNYYRVAIIDSELSTLASFIQKARQKAISNPTGDDYAIKFLEDKYVIFAGDTYDAQASTNESHNLNVAVIVSTTFDTDQVVFENFTGRTGASGAISISAYGVMKNVNINSLGIVQSID